MNPINKIMLNAARRNDWPTVQDCLAYGAYILAKDNNDDGVATWFAYHNNTQAVLALARQDASIITQTDTHGNSVTTWLAYYNNTVAILLLAKISPELVDIPDDIYDCSSKLLIDNGNIGTVILLATINNKIRENTAIITEAISLKNTMFIGMLLAAGFKKPQNFKTSMNKANLSLAG